MSEFTHFLYEYILERGMMHYIDQDTYRAARLKARALSDALQAALSEADYALWEEYMAAEREVEGMETEAIFTAAISLRKELN